MKHENTKKNPNYKFKKNFKKKYEPACDENAKNEGSDANNGYPFG